MFANRMGSEEPGSEVLQDVFFEKKGPDRNKEGEKVHQKSDINKYSHQIRDAVLRNSGLGTCGIQQAEMGQAVATSDIKQA